MLEQLEQIVATRPGAKIIGITTKTAPKMNKKRRHTLEILAPDYCTWKPALSVDEEAGTYTTSDGEYAWITRECRGHVGGEPMPYKAVYRIAERVVILACQYGSCVNRQRDREDKTPDFHPQELWKGKGRHVPGHPFLVEHIDNGKQYIAVMHLSVGQDLWCDENGNAIDPKTLKDWLPLPNDNKSQGTDKQVFWRTVDVENLVSARYAGDQYTPETPLAMANEGA